MHLVTYIAIWYRGNIIKHPTLEETSVKEQKNIKQAYIPTIEEMQSWYEDDLRREASKSSE
jgi:hypothetical protein